MYQEKFACELKIGDDVCFGGKVPQQITGVMRYKDEDGEEVITIYTADSIKHVQPNQVFQVKVY